MNTVALLVLVVHLVQLPILVALEDITLSLVEPLHLMKVWQYLLLLVQVALQLGMLQGQVEEDTLDRVLAMTDLLLFGRTSDNKWQK
jgi:hypothetical protein